jgi:hypothetical protein
MQEAAPILEIAFGDGGVQAIQRGKAAMKSM